MRFVVTLLLALIGFNLSAKAEVQLNWGRTDFPPFTILRGENAEDGVVDHMINFYIKHLPQYQHKKISASLGRVLNEMQQGRPVCHGSLLKTKKREAFVEYSLPNMVQFANGILLAPSSIEKFRPYMLDDYTVNLEKLVREGRVKIRYHMKRSYSPLIDRIIDEYADKTPYLMSKTGKKETVKEVSLLYRGTIDGLIGRPEEGQFAVKELKLSKDIRFLTIAGDKPYLFAQVGCAKGAWNDRFLKDLNKLIIKYRRSDIFADFYGRWLPKDLRQRYKKMVKRVFAE